MIVSREEVNSNETMQMFVHLSEECFLCGKPFAERRRLSFLAWRQHRNHTTRQMRRRVRRLTFSPTLRRLC
jgi:hypothetical protein